MPVTGERIGRRSLIEEAKLLQKRVANRQRQLQRLAEEQQRLQLRYQLLASIGAALAELRNKDAFGDADLCDLASEEAILLQQLPGQGVPAASVKKEEESSMYEDSMQQPFWQQQPLVETISPQDKPLQLFTIMMARPSYPVTETYPTLQDLRSQYICMIGDLSLALQQHTAGSTALQFLQAGQLPLERIKAVMFPYLHLLYTLSQPSVLPNSETVAFQLCMINLDTGQPLSEVNPQHYAWVVSQLGLTRQQQIKIATGFAVFKRLIAPVLNEQRQASAEAGAAAGAATGSAVPAAGSGSRSSLAGRKAQQRNQLQQEQQQQQQQQEQEIDNMADPFAHRRFLDLQQKRLQRLQRLQRKEMLMRSLATAYLWGCLTWEQMARLHVLLYPIAPLPGMVAATIAQLEQSQK